MKKHQVLAGLFAGLLLQFSTLQTSAQNSLEFDGIDDFVSLPTGVVSGLTGDYTIEAWVYWRGASNSVWQRIFDFGSDVTTNMFLTTNSGGGPRFAITTTGGGGEQQLTAPSALSLNTWHHFAVVIVNSTNTGRLFIDGVLVATNNAMTLRPSALGATTNNYLGRSQYADPYLNAYVDEMRISNSARYTSAFTPLTANFTVDANTVALYHFDEVSGQTVTDARGSFSGLLGATAATETSDPTRANLSTLPVSLQNFKAIVSGTTVKLNWRTGNEQGNKGFHLEHSTNGNNFSSIGFVPAGAAGGLYEFTDAAAKKGINYYRLKQEDINGRFTYSAVATARLTEKGPKITWAALGEGSVQVQLEGGSNEGFTLTDMNGRKLRQGKLVGGKIILSSLPGGIYSVTVQPIQGQAVSTAIRL